ncbi:MAG: tetratricopeptide repeat protein [Elusimicrobiales bacterium]|jgi:tetratricopeptide (TPR) repeat protein
MNKAAWLSVLLVPGFALAPCFLAASSGAPGPATVWDRIMEEQSLMNLRKGYLLMEAEKYPEAANEFLKAIARTPSEPYARILYGSSLYWLGEPDKAMSEFKTASELDPGNAVAWQLMGIVHAWKGESRQALEKFMKARDLAPDRADVKMNIGSIYHSLGDLDKALDYFREAARLEPANPLYLYQLGLLYSRLGRAADAKAAFRSALSSFRDYEDAMLELAVLEEKDGNDKEAAKLYRKALAIKPGDNVARFRLGCLFYRRGDGKNLNGLLEDAFLLTPSNAKGGISISLAYAGGPDAKEPSSGGGKPGQLEQAVARIPADEDISIKAEFISIPKTQLVARSEGRQKTLKAGLEQNFKRPEIKALRREYALPASDFKNRGARAARIADEINKAIASADREGSDTRMSINIETKKASLNPAAGAESPGVVYKPRDVGNDMGLWVMGTNWLENVEDALEDLGDPSGGAAPEPGLDVLRGLGSLIMGEPDAALAAMDGVRDGAAADLGRCAAWVEKGSQENALAACLDALGKEPKNKTALANKKWLTQKNQ